MGSQIDKMLKEIELEKELEEIEKELQSARKPKHLKEEGISLDDMFGYILLLVIGIFSWPYIEQGFNYVFKR